MGMAQANSVDGLGVFYLNSWHHATTVMRWFSIGYETALYVSIREMLACVKPSIVRRPTPYVYKDSVHMLSVLASAVHILKLERYRED